MLSFIFWLIVCIYVVRILLGKVDTGDEWKKWAWWLPDEWRKKKD